MDSNSVVADLPKEDILHHLDGCMDFITEALNVNGRILIHWYEGKSVEIFTFSSSPSSLSFAVISVSVEVLRSLSPI